MTTPDLIVDVLDPTDPDPDAMPVYSGPLADLPGTLAATAIGHTLPVFAWDSAGEGAETAVTLTPNLADPGTVTATLAPAAYATLAHHIAARHPSVTVHWTGPLGTPTDHPATCMELAWSDLLVTVASPHVAPSVAGTVFDGLWHVAVTSVAGMGDHPLCDAWMDTPRQVAELVAAYLPGRVAA